MNKLFVTASMLALCFIFSGCPYESAIPITAPTEKINPKILGSWEDSKNNTTYKVSKETEYIYRVDEMEKDQKENDHLFAHTSMINGKSFLNVLNDRPEDSLKKYSFYKMELKPNGSILLAEVSENIDERFSSSKDLKNFFAANMHKSYFFSKEEVHLVRKGK